jgi:hypothetical protein
VLVFSRRDKILLNGEVSKMQKKGIHHRIIIVMSVTSQQRSDDTNDIDGTSPKSVRWPPNHHEGHRSYEQNECELRHSDYIEGCARLPTAAVDWLRG